MSQHVPALASDDVLNAHVDFGLDCSRIRLRGTVTSAEIADLEALLEMACHPIPRRIVVDLNDTAGVDGSVIASIVAFRRTVPDTLISIDVSRLPGPRVLSMVEEVLDPSRCLQP